MRDIEAATGEDLGSNRVGKKRKGKKKKYPNLSDLKQNTNTSRFRLKKKVFNKYVTSCTHRHRHTDTGSTVSLLNAGFVRPLLTHLKNICSVHDEDFV